MAQGTAWPSVDSGLDIHSRLCQDDPVASSDFAEAYLNPLADWLLRANSRVDPHLCEQAAEEAIIALIKNPHTFDPERGAFDVYLRMSARGDLRNLLKSEGRHHARREEFADVDLLNAGRNINQEETDPALIVAREDGEEDFFSRAIPPSVARSFTREETWVLELLIQGERRTSAFALVLGITAMPEIEQRREVKRVKDRIKRRLQRARGTS